MRGKLQDTCNIEKSTLTPHTILVVEDDEALLRLIQKNLQRAGFHTEGASNGAEAISHIVSNPPELLLLDYRLPDMTCNQVVETLAEQQRSIPFIVITGHGDEKVAVEMMKLGARDYLVKDTALLDLLLSVVKRVVEQSALEKQLADMEKQYHAIFENASDAIWVQDLDGNIITANEATARLLGFNRRELAGMNVARFLSKEALDASVEVQQKLQQGEAINNPYELRLNRKDGTEAILRLTTNLLLSGSHPVGFQHVARDVTEERRAQENLRFYLQQVTKAQEEERKHIARELHDVTAQRLVALSHHLEEFTRNDRPLTPDKPLLLAKLREQVKEALQEVMCFTRDLRPPILDDLGLIPALEWLTDDLKERFSVEANLRVLGTQRRLSPEAELLLFRIIQEALTNVRRHAQASRVEVTLEFGKDKTRASVRDNGTGFEPPKTLGDLSRVGKLGLIGMQERAQLLGSSLKIRSKPGTGTTVVVEAPV
jgi:PAS domain S-box-containing protein